MNKCEWKDGKFKPCEYFNPEVKLALNYFEQNIICKSCGTDIRKLGTEIKQIVNKERL